MDKFMERRFEDVKAGASAIAEKAARYAGGYRKRGAKQDVDAKQVEARKNQDHVPVRVRKRVAALRTPELERTAREADFSDTGVAAREQLAQRAAKRIAIPRFKRSTTGRSAISRRGGR